MRYQSIPKHTKYIRNSQYWAEGLFLPSFKRCNMNNDVLVKEQLTRLIKKSHAHATLEKALEGLPAEYRGVVPDGLPYSIWQLVEHIRFCLWDILEFCKSAEHVSPSWPDGYWVKSATPASDKEWDDSLKQLHTDTNNFIELLNSKDADIHKPIPWGDGQTLLREAIVIIDHNGYHTAEIILIRRLLGIWK
jgi:hypothetical protein